MISTEIRNGVCVGYAGGVPVVGVPIARVGKYMAARDRDCALARHHLGMLEGHTDGDEIELSGFGDRFKRGLKKVANAAHKITHNKTFEEIHHKIQKAVPPPYDVFVKGGEFSNKLIHQARDKILGNKRTAENVLPAIQAVANGKGSLERLGQIAASHGVAKEARAVAGKLRLTVLAKGGDKKAEATIHALNALDQARAGVSAPAKAMLAQRELASSGSNSKAYAIKSPRTGRVYRVMVAA
jgi:hypothetical protein